MCFGGGGGGGGTSRPPPPPGSIGGPREDTGAAPAPTAPSEPTRAAATSISGSPAASTDLLATTQQPSRSLLG